MMGESSPNIWPCVTRMRGRPPPNCKILPNPWQLRCHQPEVRARAQANHWAPRSSAALTISAPWDSTRMSSPTSFGASALFHRRRLNPLFLGSHLFRILLCCKARANGDSSVPNSNRRSLVAAATICCAVRPDPRLTAMSASVSVPPRMGRPIKAAARAGGMLFCRGLTRYAPTIFCE